MRARKTIAIVITRSFVTRNILRSGTLDHLKAAGHRIVVFYHAKRIPKSLRDEFECDQVVLHPVEPPAMSKLHRVLLKFNQFLISTNNTRLLLQYDYKQNKIKKDERSGRRYFDRPSSFAQWVKLSLLGIVSQLYFIRRFARWLEYYLFPQRDPTIMQFFDEYQPDLVFATSIVSKLDLVFLKEAKRRGITTAAMPKSWDNIANQYYRFSPDHFFVPNELSIQPIIRLQDLSPDRIYAVGFPSFDWYERHEVLENRSTYMSKKGLDPQIPFLFFGSEGVWAINELVILREIYSWITQNELVTPCQLFIRPHYSNVADDIFKEFRGKEKVVIDRYKVVEDFLLDKWDPTIPDTIDLTNSVTHAAMMITAGSTLSLDAACADRPIINLGFGCEYVGDKDVTEEKLYGPDYYQWVLDTGGVELVTSYDELKEAINQYLVDPTRDSVGREKLRSTVCYRVGEESSARLGTTLNRILQTS